jgi:hypothetical protein
MNFAFSHVSFLFYMLSNDISSPTFNSICQE